MQTSVIKNKKHFPLEKLKQKKEIKETEIISTKRKMKLEHLASYRILLKLKLKETELEKKELNEAPYEQALRLDTRPIHHIFLYNLANKIDIINIFFYSNPYIHLSVSITLYIFSLLLDITFNCFLYNDDVVSEKYHNDGKLKTATSLVLSLMSNILSSIISNFLEKLSNYSDSLEAIIKESYLKNYYYRNVIKFRKYLKIKITFFFVIIFVMCLSMTYYISIFCIVYQTTQINIMINYLYGVSVSLAISIGISLLITVIRFLSIRYKNRDLYYTSRYIYQKF